MEQASERFVSTDGLCSSRDPHVVQQWNRIGEDMAAEQRAATARLRHMGVKAEHPDDGWVDRQRNEVQFAYPRFNLSPQVGDLIALGCPWKGYRLVRVTGVRVSQGPFLKTTRYAFEETDQLVEVSS